MTSHLQKVSFSRPFQLMKINSTESYVFVLARTYRGRIQLSFTITRGIYSPYVNPCVSLYRVLNLTLGTKYKYGEWLSFRRFTSKLSCILMNIKTDILNVPKHGNKHVLSHFVTVLVLCIFNKILKILFFSGKIMTSLGNNFFMQKSYSKTFLDVKFLFVTRFSNFLRHILGQKES